MEPRQFARLSIAAVGLRFSPDALSVSPSVFASSVPCCYTCTVNLSGSEPQTFTLPVFDPSAKVEPDPTQVAARFYLDEAGVSKLRSPPRPFKKQRLTVTVHSTSRQSCRKFASCLARRSGQESPTRRKRIGHLILPLGMDLACSKTGLQLHNGWTSVGRYRHFNVEFHMNAKVDLDPRYIFQFDGEPELSPQIVQIQGNIRQPIFSCRFSRDRSFRARADAFDGGHWAASDWDVCRRTTRNRHNKGRKGWLLIVYDLSGFPVAAASMVTPFVPTSGCDIVSRANPGAWLIMKAGPVGEDSWIPWGRLEAWREKGSKGGLGCRFQLLAEGGGMAGLNNYAVVMSETVISSQKGGNFLIDTSKFRPETPISASPVESPQSSGDFYFSLGNPVAHGGFVMSANVHGKGKTLKPSHVELAVRHVSCLEDAAVFMALAAAVDLSMHACLPFTKKLGKSFEQQL